jgi:hypothetical protein
MRRGNIGIFVILLGFLFVYLNDRNYDLTDASAIQIIQVVSESTKILVAFILGAIGSLLIAVDGVRVETEKQMTHLGDRLQLAISTEKFWSYCDLMEGRALQSGGQQKSVCKATYYDASSRTEKPFDTIDSAMAEIIQAGWELVTVNTIPFGASITETHWTFRHVYTPKPQPAPETKEKKK